MADPNTNPSVSLTAIRVQAVQQRTLRVNLPAETGYALYSTLRNLHMPISAFDLKRLTESKPIQVSGQLTKVTYTATEHSIYRGSVELTYARYHISVLKGLTIPAGGFASVAAFITYLISQGYGVRTADIDLMRSIRRDDGTVAIYPAKDSWLFSPDGSFDTSSAPAIDKLLTNLTTSDFDATPKLHLAILNDTLSGFNVVPPLVLDDVIINDTLTGFSPVRSN